MAVQVVEKYDKRGQKGSEKVLRRGVKGQSGVKECAARPSAY